MKDDIIIEKIEENSIAEELEIEPGDVLLSVNGKKPQDILEYKYLIDEEFLMVEIQKKSGEIWQLDIEKDYEENLGMLFKEEIIDHPKHCHNNCVFCFINQLPKGMRDSLYFKDDDMRLSFLHGNYITLTNLSEEDIDRIIEYRLQPINISVHTINPELRVKMLNNKKASNIHILLKKFFLHRISMNIQIVLVPDFNDGKELDATLRDLIKLYPHVHSISVVPVGLTKYREELIDIRSFTAEECKRVVEQIEEVEKIMQKKYKTNLVYPSDEFLIKAQKKILGKEYYGDYLQLENGVGMISYFNGQCEETLKNKFINVKPKVINILTGELAYTFIYGLAKLVMDKYPQVLIHVRKIKNNFFGSEITVSGLITGTDIIDQLKEVELSGDVLFPSNMLRFEQDKFLDDLSVADLVRQLHVNFIPVELDGNKFIEKLLY